MSENCNSSDSSDDDYPPRSKSRYPNRVRSRQPQGIQKPEGKRIGGVGAAKEPQRNDSDVSFSPASTDDTGWSKYDLKKPAIKSRNLSSKEVTKDKENVKFAFSSVQRGPVISTAKISSASSIVKKMSPVAEISRQTPVFPEKLEMASNSSYDDNPGQVILEGDKEIAAMKIASSHVTFEGGVVEVSEKLPNLVDSFKAIVGYIGSIETQASYSRPHQRLQSLRSAVRRLRVEKRVHTLVLMKVEESGVSLTSILGKTLASYPCDRIAFSGICPDDERFFGLVTLGVPDDSSTISTNCGGEDSLNGVSSSCHIFMIEPTLSPHLAHVQQAELFKVGHYIKDY